MADESQEPKIIIDEDWKSQVEREKAEAEAKRKQEQQQSESQSPAPPSESGDSSAAESSPGPGPTGEESGEYSASQAAYESTASSGDESIPPASFAMLVNSLATQAMASMGQLPGEDGQPLPINLDFARHFIDSLAVLEEKTKGNLTEEEAGHLGEALHQLRMLFVTIRSQHGAS